MKRLVIIIAVLLLIGAGVAWAQSTATPIVIGYLTTSGCPGSQTVCWMPYNIANPLQTSTQQAAQLVANFLASVQSAITESDNTLKRVQEAISLGTTTATTADVVAFVQYRRALRALLSSTSVGTLPTKPAYPVGS